MWPSTIEGRPLVLTGPGTTGPADARKRTPTMWTGPGALMDAKY